MTILGKNSAFFNKIGKVYLLNWDFSANWECSTSIGNFFSQLGKNLVPETGPSFVSIRKSPGNMNHFKTSICFLNSACKCFEDALIRSASYSFVRKSQYWLPELLLSCLFALSVKGITRSLSLYFNHF